MVRPLRGAGTGAGTDSDTGSITNERITRPMPPSTTISGSGSGPERKSRNECEAWHRAEAMPLCMASGSGNYAWHPSAAGTSSRGIA